MSRRILISADVEATPGPLVDVLLPLMDPLLTFSLRMVDDASRLLRERSVGQETLQGNPGLKALQNLLAPAATTDPSIEDGESTTAPT